MDGTTGIVIAVIVALVGIVAPVLKLYANKEKQSREILIRQAELSIQLVSIEKELVEIKSLLVESQCNYNKLDKRLIKLEGK